MPMYNISRQYSVAYTVTDGFLVEPTFGVIQLMPYCAAGLL